MKKGKNNSIGQYSLLDSTERPFLPTQEEEAILLPQRAQLKSGMFKNQDGQVHTNEWLTPPEIIRSLGEFDLDPCAPVVRPWEMAKCHFTEQDNGLIQRWFGRVWMNPPYDRSTIEEWMRKMATHNCGVALTFARTDRNSFHDYVFPIADSILFIRQRLTFYTADGKRAPANGGAPSVLIAYGQANSQAIADSGIKGTHVPLNSVQIVVIKVEESWRVVVKTVLVKLNQPAALEAIYREVENHAKEKVSNNQHFRAKVRQILQLYFRKVDKGTYTLLSS